MVKAVTVILIIATLFFSGCGTNRIEPDLNKSAKVDCNCATASTASSAVIISNSEQKAQKISVPAEDDDDCTSGLIYGREYKTILAQ